MAKNNSTLIIVGLLVLVVLFVVINPMNFIITGDERMSRNVPSLVDAGSTLNVPYTVTGSSGNWAATVVETLICNGYANQVKQFVIISDEGTSKTISYSIPNKEGMTCTLQGDYQFGNSSIIAFSTKTIQTKVTVSPIVLIGFSSQLNANTFTGTLTWSGGQSPYTVEIENFGDGTDFYEGNIVGTSKTITHTYSQGGTYNIEYCIYDENSYSENYCGTKTITIQICNGVGDTNCDGVVSRAELGTVINKWITGELSRNVLGNVIQAWAGS